MQNQNNWNNLHSWEVSQRGWRGQMKELPLPPSPPTTLVGVEQFEERLGYNPKYKVNIQASILIKINNQVN